MTAPIRSHAEEASIACFEALERLVRGELYFAGRWVMLADTLTGKVEDAGTRRQLDEIRERIENLATRCQRSTASRRCAECDEPLRFGDHYMCPSCRLIIVERVLASEVWRSARPGAVWALEELQVRLERVATKRNQKR